VAVLGQLYNKPMTGYQNKISEDNNTLTKLTNITAESPSQANRILRCSKNPYLLRNQKVYYHVLKSPYLEPEESNQHPPTIVT
jgi:hypothetical protein